MSTQLAKEPVTEFPPNALTLAENNRLEELELVISRGLETFYEVGKALLEIRDSRLYRAEFDTFENYCRELWEMSKTHANRLIQSAEVIAILTPTGVIPTTERQTRELASLEPEEQKTVWQAAVETAPRNSEGKPVVTAAHIKSIVAANSGNGTEGDDWNTPSEYIEAARKVLGEIDLDPASSDIAQETVKAASYFTIEDDGLSTAWQGRVWLNPPYSYPLIEKFTQHAIAQFEEGNISAGIILVNNCTDAAWFHALLERFVVCFTRGRIPFWRPNQASFSTRQGQAIFYMGKHEERFAKVFSQFGIVVEKI